MKRNILISISIVFSILIVSCTESPPKMLVSPSIEPPSTEGPFNSENVDPSPKNSNGSEEALEMVEIFIGSKADLTEIFWLDFTDAKITDIWIDDSSRDYTEVFLFCVEGNNMLSNVNFQEDAQKLGDILSKHYIGMLKEAELSVSDIQALGSYFKEFYDGFGHTPYSIEIFRLKEPRDDGSNLFICAGPSAKVIIDVEKILAE
jgi:hypothetical protein